MNLAISNIGGIFHTLFYSIFKKHSISHKLELVFREIVRIGVESIGVVMFASILGGLIAVFLIDQRLGSYIPDFYITEAISKSTIIELGALGASIALVGRAGTRITAEIATMKVNEEIDALETMAINPYDYLVYPKMIAALISYPIMVIFSEILIILGAMIFMVYIKGFCLKTFLFGIREHFRMLEFIQSLVKGAVFGLISTSISCYFGLNARKGARGVGEATTNGVVYSVVAIFLFDYIIIRIFSLWL